MCKSVYNPKEAEFTRCVSVGARCRRSQFFFFFFFLSPTTTHEYCTVCSYTSYNYIPWRLVWAVRCLRSTSLTGPYFIHSITTHYLDYRLQYWEYYLRVCVLSSRNFLFLIFQKKLSATPHAWTFEKTSGVFSI